MSRTVAIFAGFALLSAACLSPDYEQASSRSLAAYVSPSSDQRCQLTGTSPTQIDYAQAGLYQVGVLDITFVDNTRPVLANAKHPAAPARTLVTTVYYPAGGPPPLFGTAQRASGGPFPLLVHSHGYGSSRSEAVPLGNRAASHGYIVVGVDFPFTNTDVLLAGQSPDTSDIINQAGDVSFLIDQLLELSRDPNHVLANAVDEARIGVTGVSLGGLTTLLVTFHPKLQDPRIKASAPIAPLSSFFMREFYQTRELPLLLVSGDRDAFIDYALNARRSFERAAPNARLVTLEKGTHAAFAMQLDAASLALMNVLLAPADADPTNADAYGCALTGEILSTDHDYMPALGGRENFIDYDPVREPIHMCQGDEYKHPGMDAALQSELATRTVLAFFEAHLGGTPARRESGCRSLLQPLPSMRVE